MKQKTYRTQRLELRPLRASDFEAWARAHESAGPKTSEWDISPATRPNRVRSRFTRRLPAQTASFKKRGIFLWGLFRRDNGDFVGWVDVATIAREPQQMANLGWFVFNHQRGQGFAREAATKIISVALSDLGFHRLEASIHPRNRASIAVAKSLKLRREGLKKFYQKIDGVWRDMLVFITTPELFYER